MSLYELGENERMLEELLYENGGEVTPEIEELMNDNEENLRKKADGYAHIVRELRYYAQNCGAESQRFADQKKRAEKGADRVMAHLLDLMERFGWHNLEGVEAKFSQRKSKALLVDEETVFAENAVYEQIGKLNLPDYIDVKVTISKKAINDMVKAGGEMPTGCTQVENTSLILK